MRDSFEQFPEKVTLLCDPENPLIRSLRNRWAAESGRWNVKGARDQLYGVSSQTLGNWERGRLDAARERESIHRVCEHLQRETGVCLRLEHFTDRVSTYAFGELLGMNWRDTQLSLDKKLYAQPVRAKGYILDKPIADRLYTWYDGIYRLYYLCPASRPRTMLVVAALRIRHVVPTPNDLAVIACKLHVPKHIPSTEAPDFYPYQGLLTQPSKHPHLYLSFSERSRHEHHDMVNICAEPSHSGVMHGMLSSVSFDKVMYSTALYIQKLPLTAAQKTDRDYIKQRMRQDLRILDTEEAKQRLFEEQPAVGAALKEPFCPFDRRG